MSKTEFIEKLSKELDTTKTEASKNFDAVIKCIDHATLQRWVIKFMPIFERRFRKRKKLTNGSWRIDETYIKVKGKWVYLYRDVDKYGDTIDFLLRAKRDARAAKAFFKKAMKFSGHPIKVNIDKSTSNTSALNSINRLLSEEDTIEIRQNKYLNNRIEGDHIFIKKRTRLMLGLQILQKCRQKPL